ncbi:MAG: 3-methyl-2-oxobutanoate hydroxymethyltransferase, partial [Acidimicrobiia bacterium]|nr:3-methyl-2-oxobutanoate hydroxymethyltransferase [Acidimicrobiia bacterium]
MAEKVTVPQIRDRKGGPKISMLTAYDYPTARMADQAGVDVLLVGDSVANVVHGMDDTLGVTVDDMILHTRAVERARPNAL